MKERGREHERERERERNRNGLSIIISQRDSDREGMLIQLHVISLKCPFMFTVMLPDERNQTHTHTHPHPHTHTDSPLTSLLSATLMSVFAVLPDSSAVSGASGSCDVIVFMK